VKVEGRDEVIEWAVKMERLPEETTLENRLELDCGKVGVELMEALARQVASFHARAEGGDHVSAFGRFEVVAGNARENFDQVVPQVGTTIEQTVFDRLRSLTEETLARFRPRIESRAARGRRARTLLFCANKSFNLRSRPPIRWNVARSRRHSRRWLANLANRGQQVRCYSMQTDHGPCKQDYRLDDIGQSLTGCANC
jgi:hypothetical protein